MGNIGTEFENQFLLYVFLTVPYFGSLNVSFIK